MKIRTINFKLLCLILMVLASECLLGQTWSTPAPKTRANNSIDSMLKILDSAKSDISKVQVLNNLARWTFILAYNAGSNDWESAINYANHALTLAEKMNNKKEKAQALFILGEVLKNKGNHAEALKKFFMVLKISKEINDKPCVREQYFMIGRVYSEIGNNNEALKYLTTALKMINEEGVRGLKLFNCYKYTGMVHHGLGNYREALKLFIDAFEEAKLAQLPHATGIMYRYIGNVYSDLGNFKESLKYHIAALENTLETSNSIGASHLQFKRYLDQHYTDIGTVYYKQAAAVIASEEANEVYLEALKYLQKGLVIAEEIQDKPTVLNAYFGLSNAYKGIDDTKKALHYLNLYLQLKDSLYNNDLYRKISDINTLNELEKARIEETARQQLIVANEKGTRERLLGEQKLQQEKVLTNERITNERALAEQKLEQEKAISIAGEKANYEKSIAVEKIRNEKQQANNLLLMGLILVVVTSVFLILYFRQRHEKKRAVEKVKTVHQMAELEMQSLRSQLNPHFMFNSLNSIQSLIMKEQTDKSQSYLSRFARLLRMLLENADKPFVPLRMEMEFLHLYLSLESLRIPDMQYSISTDPSLDTEQILIPNMILQPYVENAIWHGLSHKETDKQLQIRIFRKNGTINYEIEDNGVGRKKSEELKSLFRRQHQSKGMELLNKRINLLNTEYGSTIQTEISDVIRNNEVTGTLVTIKIPVKLSAPLLN